MKEIVITSGYRWSYFEWFLLGFHELEQQGKIKFRMKTPFWSKTLSRSNGTFTTRLANKCIRMFEKDSYNMTGYIVDGNVKKTFVIDSADAPYLFDEQQLKEYDIYFKMQCPKDFSPEGFELTKDIRIPWCDHAHVEDGLALTARGRRKVINNLTQYLSKIKPLMIGPRQLSRSTSYQQLEGGYQNYLKDRKLEKTKKLMCYFGNAKGPGAESNVTDPDWDWERDLIGYFGDKVSHPNEKRGIAADFMARLGDEYDARVISRDESDGSQVRNENLVIPLPEFCAHIANFEYNLNISGYRMSIPNRFIESMLVGTAVVTDKLHVKWYQPFDSEVCETVEMGYMRNDEVDWNQFKKDIQNLPKTDPAKIVEAFEKKWSPTAVADYIIDTVMKDC
ncbi:MAG: hypothetical protein DUD31_04810 [Coriobacteriaceae bacterium]|nr:MAG: hypothetical protein DUD31_04810 [Coriobacteriaceae bacterium]